MTDDLEPRPGWHVTRIDQIATVEARIGWKALTADEYVSEGYAFLATPNIKATEIDFQNVNRITNFRYEESPGLKLRLGDVLLAKDGNTLGIANVVTRLPEAATVNGSIAVLRPLSIEPRFLRYWLASSYIQGKIGSLKDGMGVPHLFQRDINRLPVLLPPLDEQRRIADFLDAETRRLDYLSAVTRRQAVLVQERYLEWLRSCTTGTDDDGTRLTGIPWMPTVRQDWALDRIARVFRTGSGTTPTATDASNFGGRHHWVNTGDLRDAPITSTGKTLTDAALERFTTLTVYPPGSLLIAMYGATIGRTGLLRIPASVNQACCVLYQAAAVSTEFTWHWFVAHRSAIVSLASGAGQPNISQEVIRSLRVPVPSADEQARIVTAVRAGSERSEAVQSVLNQRVVILAERRQALITSAVTGQLDVTTARGFSA